MPESETTTKMAETVDAKAKDDAGATPATTEAKADPEAGKAMKAERDLRKAAETELKAIKAEREAEKTKALEDAGNYKAIADTHAAELAALKPRFAEYESTIPALKEKADKLEALIKQQVDAQKAALKLQPAIAELLDSKSATEQLEWLSKHAAEVAKAGPILVPGAPSGGSKEISEEERRRRSRPTSFA